MVEVRYHGRFGNNLFQYALGRIIAQELGFALHASPIEGCPNTSEVVSGICAKEPEQVLREHHIDLAAILGDQTPRKIILDGYFQRQEYYAPFRPALQRWFRQESVPSSGSFAATDVVAHIRRRDYVRHGYALPFAFYEHAITQALPPNGRLTIATDDPWDPFFWRFSRWKPQFLKGSNTAQMHQLLHAPRLVMSASSYSWWPAFLGDAELIICPEPSCGVWDHSRSQGPDLFIPEKFTALGAMTPYSPNALEAAYQRCQRWRCRLVEHINRKWGACIRVPSY